MPKPDALDYAVSVTLVIVLLVVVPVLVGRAMTPHLDGEPQLLNATILQEQQYIDEVQATLALCAEVHTYLQDLPPAEQALSASGELQKWVDATDQTWTELDETSPPGRFTALHDQVLALIKLYRYLSGEAWAYYGDLDKAHLEDVQQGLAEGSAEQARLGKLVKALDFQHALRHVQEPSARATPTALPELTLPEWEG